MKTVFWKKTLEALNPQNPERNDDSILYYEAFGCAGTRVGWVPTPCWCKKRAYERFLVAIRGLWFTRQCRRSPTLPMESCPCKSEHPAPRCHPYAPPLPAKCRLNPGVNHQVWDYTWWVTSVEGSPAVPFKAGVGSGTLPGWHGMDSGGCWREQSPTDKHITLASGSQRWQTVLCVYTRKFISTPFISDEGIKLLLYFLTLASIFFNFLN